nr:NADH dehydrogenase subunit 4 [Nais communis]
MLETIMTLSSLLLLPVMSNKYWHTMMITLVMLTAYTLTLSFSSTLIKTSSYMMTDSLSSTLTVLSLWITFLMMLASYKIMHTSNMPKLFMLTSITLLMTLMASFNVSSMLIFYTAFEASLLPTMFLIMMWGYQPERLQASMYLMLYTVSASLPLLLIILKIKWNSMEMLNMSMPDQFSTFMMDQPILWLLLIMAFLVKLPMFMFHLWLPKAHVEAPVAGSMILAAILLKLGGYGLARSMMMFSYMNKLLATPIMSVALVGGVITSMICMRQSDMKSLIAYSSIGHMGLMLAAMMTSSKLGMQASMSMMLAHGLSSSAMFCMANITYNMTMTRSLTLTKGLLSIMPMISFWWFMFCCANMAAPPTINLMSEIFLITATMSYSLMTIIPLGMISFITVLYSLYLYSTTNHGPSMSSYNPMPHISVSDMMLMTLHLVPIILLILKPELIMTWC